MACRIAVLVSGRGSNLQALIQAVEAGAIDGQIVAAFSDRPECAALKVASAANIPTQALRPSDFHSREAFNAALFELVDATQPDLIICAGYMRLISPDMVRSHASRLINIHPSLLPRHRGLDTHERALAAGDREHGASVHLVSAEVDAGAILAQARLVVAEGENADALSARVLQLEHRLLVATVRSIADGTITLADEQGSWRGNVLAAPLSLNSKNQLEDTE